MDTFILHHLENKSLDFTIPCYIIPYDITLYYAILYLHYHTLLYPMLLLYTMLCHDYGWDSNLSAFSCTLLALLCPCSRVCGCLITHGLRKSIQCHVMAGVPDILVVKVSTSGT